MTARGFKTLRGNWICLKICVLAAELFRVQNYLFLVARDLLTARCYDRLIQQTETGGCNATELGGSNYAMPRCVRFILGLRRGTCLLTKSDRCGSQ